MNFIEALEAMERGERVRHKSWAKNQYIRQISDGIHVDNGNVRIGVISIDTIHGGWSIVRQTFDFAEAVRRMAGGAMVTRAGWKFGTGITGSERIGDRLTPVDVSATDWEEA